MTQEMIVFPESFFALIRYYLLYIYSHTHFFLIATWFTHYEKMSLS